MELLEWALIPKTPSGRGEDRVVIAPHYLAVIDGASSLDERRDGSGRTGGALVADTLASALQALGPLPAEALVRALSRAVRAALDASGFATGPRPAASAAIHCRQQAIVLRVGDCGFVVDGRINRPLKAVDALLTNLRAFSAALGTEALSPSSAQDPAAGGDAARAAILPFLRAQHHLQNRTGAWGFGVFDGSTVPPAHITQCPGPPGSEVTLFTDGYPAPARSLAEAEHLLQQALRDDPACLGRNPGTKGWAGPPARSYDDRAYLRFRT
ncbi:MAG: protein phosphatase 2C domain-containing protein [Pararhodobacter sp.]